MSRVPSLSRRSFMPEMPTSGRFRIRVPSLSFSPPLLTVYFTSLTVPVGTA